MLRKILFVLAAAIISSNVFAQSGTLQGRVLDAGNGEAIAFANVSVESNGQIITGGMTDFDGKFVIKPIPAGTYDVKASYVGYHPLQYKGLKIMAGKITFQDFKITSSVQQLNEVEVKEYKVPLISKDQTSTGGAVTSEEISKMPGRSAEAVATTVGGVYSERGEVGSIRGSRSEATVYYIDGVKVSGGASRSMPKSATSQVEVITGGVPAKYGDVTGGIISVTTKEPSREIFGGVELVTSHFLDAYDYNLAELMVTGPLFSKKTVDKYDSTKVKKNVIAGFFISASFNYEKDNQPSAIGWWKANDGVTDELLSNPYRTNAAGIGTILNSEFLSADNFQNVKARDDAEATEMMVTAKIDVKPSRNINLTFGGTFDYNKFRDFNYSNTLFNSKNNGEAINRTVRGYARLTQKFQSENDKDNATALIKNAYYQIQVDYQKFNQTVQDRENKEDLFKYGYVGKFTTTQERSYRYTYDLPGFASGVYEHDGFRDLNYAFEASDVNPDLASYTSSYYSLYPANSFWYQNKERVQAGGGLLNGESPNPVYSFYNSPGTPYNTFYKIDNSQFRLSASGSADIKDHEISLGFEFEQRDDRYFGVNPMGLWDYGRKYTNFHIQELDTNNRHLVYDANLQFQDTIWYDRMYNAEAQTQFDQKLREALGMPVDGTNWIDFDSYDPSIFSIDFFSAPELLDNQQVSYYGYDHHGNRLTTKPSFNDFLTAKDENGRFKREIPSFQPIYGAAYIQDKFAFNDLVFNVGLRVDRFDANQMVLKDPYSFYETKKLGEVSGSLNPSGAHPNNLSSDAVVYTNAPGTQIKGYREGFSPTDAKWYDANGTQINDPKAIEDNSSMHPVLVNPGEELSVNAFKDYEPQINVMPRIAFSFPVSDVALFFAHYDVLTKRPSSNVRMNPLQYYYIQKQTDAINNPDLKTEKTIDYELGFQQKLNNTSSIKFSTFYREMRDMVQVQYIYGAYPFKYMTYTNIDFGTVKGLTLAYDLRRTGNITFRLSYTLQFANGTGSNAETSKALIQTGQPNLRATIPLDFDQRHAITGNLDYRYASGRAYTGPKVAGKDILQNTGANFTFNYGTGSPYNKKDLNNGNLIGSINGSRKPSRFTINMRIDRDFELNYGKGEGDNKKTAGLNVYVEINNLLNTKEIINVYETTGNADDDGYLNNALNQSSINAQNDPQAYRDYRTMYINSPYNYSFARTIHLGIQLSF
ncbi:MAG: carboxypeptidase-like regulatory domain-containing protein [Bacteroidia bacterium]|nr:carboxypeptidase-like regulatory domain-containing protein [Bacteroidia bacterium]